MHEENVHNDLQSITTHALEEMERDLGIKDDPDHINLAETSRRPHLSRGKLKRLQEHGFVVVPTRSIGNNCYVDCMQWIYRYRSISPKFSGIEGTDY